MQVNEQPDRNQIQRDRFFHTETETGFENKQADCTAATGNDAVGSFAQRFMRTLQQIEATGDPQPLVALFAEEADVSNLALSEPLQGKQQIRQFWQNYLSVFDRIQSHFTHVAEANGTITLEWISEGALSSGEPLSYRGVSILETKDDQIQHFRTYYDSAVFLPQGAK